MQKEVVDSVLIKVNSFKESGEIRIPPDYSPENALKSAWLILQETTVIVDKDKKITKPVLEHCTRHSIANCLLDMVTQGLSPVKKQCYFIAYGKTLTLSRSYMGAIASAKRYGNVKDIIANVIYEKDEFDFEIEVETGIKKILRHKQTLQSIDGEIIGAYAIVTTNDNSKYIELMTMKQILAAWNQGKVKGNSPAHINFKGEMVKKSVINRACKLFINTSSDAVLFEEEFETIDHVETRIQHEIADNSNKGEILSIDDNNVIDVPQEPTEENNPIKPIKSQKATTPAMQNEQSSISNQIAIENARLEPGF